MPCSNIVNDVVHLSTEYFPTGFHLLVSRLDEFPLGGARVGGLGDTHTSSSCCRVVHVIPTFAYNQISYELLRKYPLN